MTPFRGRARYLDGVCGAVRDVAVAEAPAERVLLLVDGDRVCARWPLDGLRRLPDQAGDRIVLESGSAPLARLVLEAPEARDAFLARDFALAPPPRAVGLRRIAIWGAAAVASVALILWGVVPAMSDRMARLLPPQAEVALGDSALSSIQSALGEQMPVLLCSGPEGQAALEALGDRLAEGAELPHDLRLAVLDHPMQNAFALPGGRVILFRGLLALAESPDEIAAVLAHEIGHQAARDPTRLALRSAGSVGILGLLVGDFSGGTGILFVANRLIQARYSQHAETAADVYGMRLLDRARISPEGLAALFERVAEGRAAMPDFLAHLVSHPDIMARIDAARTAAAAGRGYTPALPPEAWAALRNICAEE